MRLLQVNYGEQESLKDVTVNMTADEALAIVNILGKLNGHAQKRLGIDSDAYDCLAGVFNREDDDGYKDLHITLETLNEPADHA